MYLLYQTDYPFSKTSVEILNQLKKIEYIYSLFVKRFCIRLFTMEKDELKVSTKDENSASEEEGVL
jgi:hypothetical protein